MKTPLLSFLTIALLASLSQAEPFLAKDGVAHSEILIAEDAPRGTRLAAWELQHYVKKLTGAELSIGSEPNPEVPLKIYIGQSQFTDDLGITTEGLEAGAYRIVSGEDWITFIGDDTDYVPVEPWPRNSGDQVRCQEEWNEITGAQWGFPLRHAHKYYTGRTFDFGKEGHVTTYEDGRPHMWAWDERGSFNAVNGYLRSLGVRWYLPGKVGEVLPEMTALPLPKIDETVQPAFPVRQVNVRFGVASEDTEIWAMRLGIRDPYGLQIAHGMNLMTHNAKTLTEHPDWFALYGGKRDNQLGERLNHLCYSNEELFDETVKWARAQFDHFDMRSVSVMPPDAYISMCQCPKCEGKDTPERDYRGRLSDHVWDFVNRVAIEVGKTHPDKKIVCCAYGANTMPPLKINKLEPNVQVVIVGGRRPRNNLPEQQQAVRELREGWLEKTDNPIMVFENYPFTARGFYLPAFVGRTIGETINQTKGVSDGEDIWLSFSRDFDTKDVGFNHFQVYFTTRMYWGDKDQDVEAMIEEYCRLFYGPAAEQMQAFFYYSEDNWQDMESDKSKVDHVLGLFADAKAQVKPESIHGKRVALIDDFLESLRSKSEQLGKVRGPVPKVRLVSDAEGIVIDGKLDDKYWTEKCPVAATGRLRELEVGGQPIYATSFQAGWNGGSMYLAIKCEEKPGEPLNIVAKGHDDPAMWYGDVVEVLIETDSHSYYQIAVDPQGSIADLDRGATKESRMRWESQAEVATQIADDHWIIEMRIPVTDDENDPLNQVIGRHPTQSLPWYINICRQRIRENGRELSALSPTGSHAFHVPMKFAHFYDGKSHAFETSEPDEDYLLLRKTAEDLFQQRQYSEVINTLVSTELKLSDFQKVHAYSLAASAARAMDDYDRANELADQIPIPAAAKTLRMENLLAQRDYEALVQAYAAEDLRTWPFWNIGEAATARGRALSAVGKGEAAEKDLTLALDYTPDIKLQQKLLRDIGTNQEKNLGDMEGAIEAYMQVVNMDRANGGADYFYNVQAANRALRSVDRYDEAMAALNKVDMENLSGTWRATMFLHKAETLADMGKSADAKAIYQGLLTDDQIDDRYKQQAQAALDDQN